MKKIIKILFSPFFSFLFPILLTSCSSNEGFYFANFESYISQDLLNELESKDLIGFNGIKIDNFNYRTFSTNEDLERNFLTNYDIAVPSTYLTVKLANEGQLLPIDWSNFKLHKLDENGMQTNEMIKTASDALTLFTPQVRSILLTYSLEEAYEKDKNNIDPNGGLLNYCVPYFLQNFGFAYKTVDGNEWDEFSTKYSWKTIIESIKNHENYVKKVSAVDDSRTLYSIARLIETNDENINPGDLQPGLSNTYINPVISEIEYSKTYKNLINDLPKNLYYLNTDSNNVLNSFASPKYKGGSEAIFSYNGDILFGIQGGDNYAYDEEDNSDFKEWIKNYTSVIDKNSLSKNEEFFIKKATPDNSFLLLDTMVINKNRVKSESEKQLAYSILYKIGLEGSDLSLYDSKENKVYSEKNKNIFSVNEDKEYIYGPMLNFDYVQYTSPLLTLNAYVLNSSNNINKYNNENVISSYNIYNSLSSNVKGKGYFTDLYKEEDLVISENNNGFLTEKQYKNYIKTLIDVYEITNLGKENTNSKNIQYFISNFTPRNISDLNKSNMSWAYSDVKSNYF